MHCTINAAMVVQLLVVVLVVLGGCSGSGDFQGAQPALPHLAKAAGANNSFGFAVGEFQGGWAAICDNGEAFWTKAGKPYYVNDAAKAIAPDLEKAPENIQFDDAFQAAAKAE